MARKVLGGDRNSSSNSPQASTSKKPKDKSQDPNANNNNNNNGNNNGQKSTKSGDELGDFSKLESDPRVPLNVRQIFKITKSWKAIARTMAKTGTAMFLT